MSWSFERFVSHSIMKWKMSSRAELCTWCVVASLKCFSITKCSDQHCTMDDHWCLIVRVQSCLYCLYYHTHTHIYIHTLVFCTNLMCVCVCASKPGENPEEHSACSPTHDTTLHQGHRSDRIQARFSEFMIRQVAIHRAPSQPPRWYKNTVSISVTWSGLRFIVTYCDRNQM